MGTIKDRNHMDLTEAEDIKKRRKEYWPGLPFPSPGVLPDPGVKPRSPALQADSLLSEPPGPDIKKRWQEYTGELYKKDHHGPDNHDGVITRLEIDILECEVKWASGSIIMNKASVSD